MGEVELAIPHLEEAEEMMPSNSNALTYFACAKYLTGQFEVAEKEVRRALQIDGANL